MGRPENPLDPSAGPVEQFAFALRKLRNEAGRPTYRELARRSGFSATALTAAARGDRLPSAAVAAAFAEACGGEREEWQRRWQEAADAVAAVESATAPGARLSPYPGLAAFEEEDADRFFGRESLVTDLVEQLGQSRFVAVVGPSGSGKSSLLRAGVIPAVRAGLRPDEGPVSCVSLTPGSAPMAALKAALAADGPEAPDERLVVVDQFEEVFTLCGDPADRAAFIDALLPDEHADPPMRVMIALRGDYYGHCAGYRRLAAALRAASVLVAPMTAAELREAIVKPAAREDVTAQPALVATVIAEAGDEPGMLPLVSHALRETWLRRRGKALTLDAYQAAGGIHGAIARTAEELYESLSDGQRDLTRRLLLRLIAIGEDAQVARRPMRRADLPGGEDDDLRVVLDLLAAARLVTLDRDLVQLAHEALITAWPRLHEWVDGDRDGMRIHQLLAEAARSWRDLDGDAGALYRGTRLATAREWAERAGTDLTDVERAFLDASTAAEDAERQAARRRARRLRVLATAMAVLLIVATAAGAVAERQRRLADQRLHQSRSRELAAQARVLAPADQEAGLRLAARAYRLAPTVEARSALLSIAGAPGSGMRLIGPGEPVHAMAFSPDGRTLATGGGGPVRLWDTVSGRLLTTFRQEGVWSLAFSADARLLAIGDDGGGVSVWDVAHRNRRQTTRLLDDPVEAVAFDPTARMIAAGAVTTHPGRFGQVTVWEPGNGRTRTYRGERTVARLGAEQGDWLRTGRSEFPFALFAGYSRDGRTQVETRFTVDSRAAEKSQPDTGAEVVVRRPGATEWRMYMSFDGAWALDPEGRVLFVGAGTGEITAWNLVRRSRLAAFPGVAAAVETMTVSRDGRMLATASENGDVTVHDRRRMPLLGHTGTVESVVYSPDGRTIASAGDSTVTLWDPVGRRPRAALASTGKRTPVRAVAYSPDGRVLATGDEYGTVRLWEPATGRTIKTLHSTDESVTAYDPETMEPLPQASRLTFSSDGGMVAATFDQGRVRWDARTGTAYKLDECSESWEFDPRQDRIICFDDRTVASRLPTRTPLKGEPYESSPDPGDPGFFSPDGRFLAVLGRPEANSQFQLWDTGRRKKITALPQFARPARAVAIGPEGRLLAIAGADNTITLWDLHREELWATLTGDGKTVTSLAFSPDGSTLASGNASHMVTLWPLDTTATVQALTSPN
ncbi:nSTAND1 domain-containing NTPase [Actinomadura fibrosa]|uniref:HTH cro/C1-type domain-containing protein n=1 Tax=Actinomadura fibrosa TaxID=111802 RepID=A0ABW2XVJ3_9ACTN|nr:hypothetical protein [Actinomadura fibrosa]